MTSPVEQIRVQCPCCGFAFETWHRASMNLGLEEFSPDYIRKMSTAGCPECKHEFDLGSLITGEDNIWRQVVSGIAGQRKRRYKVPVPTLEQIASDLSTVLNSGITEYSKRRFINLTLWAWSEYDGKYTTRFRSATFHAAVAECRQVDRRHDHAVPRKLLINRIMEMGDQSKQALYDFLNEHCMAVTLTKEEDILLRKCGLQSSMPKGWDWDDPLARYSAAGINLVMRDGSPVSGRYEIG